MVEQYSVGSEQGRAVRLEGRIITHSRPLQHGLLSMPAQYNGLIRIIVVVTGFVLQVILSVYLHTEYNSIPASVFCQRGSVDMLFLFVYTKMFLYYSEEIIFFFCPVFSTHEICILWLFLSDMIDCVSHFIGTAFGRLTE